MNNLKVEVKVVIAKYVAGYEDRVPLYSGDMIFPNEDVARDKLRRLGYSDSFIDIDTTKGDLGWKFVHETVVFMPESFNPDKHSVLFEQCYGYEMRISHEQSFDQKYTTTYTWGDWTTSPTTNPV